MIYACVRMCFPSLILYLHYKMPLERLRKFTWMFLTVVFIEALITLGFSFFIWITSNEPFRINNDSPLLEILHLFYVYKTAFWLFITCFMFPIGMVTLCCGSKRNTDGYEQIWTLGISFHLLTYFCKIEYEMKTAWNKSESPINWPFFNSF